jgi:hypothetical protein
MALFVKQFGKFMKKERLSCKKEKELIQEEWAYHEML